MHTSPHPPLQAGKRVADEVEGALLRRLQEAREGERGENPALVAPPQAESAEGGEGSPTAAAAASPGKAGGADAEAPLSAGSKRRRSAPPAEASPPSVAAPSAAAAGGAPGAPLHIETPPLARGAPPLPSPLVRSVVWEQAHWEAAAAAAPHTASKGRGYEFVYHAAEAGLLSAAAATAAAAPAAAAATDAPAVSP